MKTATRRPWSRRVEDIRPFREIRHHHFVDELGRAVLNDRRRLGEEGDLQLGRARVARGGGMSEKRGGEGQHHQARKGHMFFSELCFAGELRLRHSYSLFRPTASTCFVMDAARIELRFSYSIEGLRIDPTECLAVSPHRECRPPISCAPRCDHRSGAANGERRGHGRGADRRRRSPRRYRRGHRLSLFPGEKRSRRRALGGDRRQRDRRFAARGRRRTRAALGPVGCDHHICRARSARPQAFLRGHRRADRCRARRGAACFSQIARG